MAEVAGLVLGVAGLAGLIGLFRDTVDLFTLFADAHHVGRDYEILDTKLDIEKMLLLKWADRVRLLRPDHDERLDDEETQALVGRILDCIAQLLSDTKELRDRYGLIESVEAAEEVAPPVHQTRPGISLPPGDPAVDVVPSPETRPTRISQFRWRRFLEEFERLRGNARHRTIPIRTRARWVIRDKQRFDDLIQQLGHFISKINELLPVTNNSCGRSDADPATEDVESLTDLRSLKLVRKAATDLPDLEHSAKMMIDKKCRSLILDSLWFRTIDERRQYVEEAHFKTLSWALDPPDGSEMPWDDLPEWLRSGSGIYWVSGKAGSGKSTLMKHLLSQPRLREHLSAWSVGHRLSVFHFFFTDLGSPEQKTQQGLLRTLLFQILTAHQHLIPLALPGIWRELQNGRGETACLPSPAEAKAAFDTISDNCHATCRFLVMIDGLDEFSGDLQQGIAFIKSLASNEYIKVIISSRPIPTCVAAFGGSPSLRLQDLNRSDIEAYIRDVIEGDPNTQRYIRRDPEQTTTLIQDIINKSAGVFLWVVLVGRVLQRGFADYDRLSELRQRVDELPRELEDMFQHMLSKIEVRYREQGARLLRLLYERQATMVDRSMLALGLALVCDYHLNPPHLDRLNLDERQDLCDELEGRLRSRCGGLLELVPSVANRDRIQTVLARWLLLRK